MNLASMIEFHISNCVIVDCVCKKRDNIYNPKKGKYVTLNAVLFKDKIFMKHLVLEMLINSF